VGVGVRSGPGAARTMLLFHIIIARPSKLPLMVRTFLKVYMELGSSFLFPNKGHHHHQRRTRQRQSDCPSSSRRRSGEYRKGMIPARPLYQGGCGSVWDPEPSKEQVGDWGGPATVWSLWCVAETRARRPNGEWGYSTCRQCWATSAQRRCHTEEALYLPTFSNLFDCQ